MSNLANSKMILEQHRDNLKACSTFEEYRDCHVSYVEYLIGSIDAKIVLEEAETNFVTKSIWKMEEKK